MTQLRFEWDERKAQSNLHKHGVAFSEATSVFDDARALLIDDPDHSNVEMRWIIFGMSEEHRVLAVVHVYREDSGTIRLISARTATRLEKVWYFREWKQ